MTRTSAYGFAETVQRLEAAIVAHGNTLFAKIDQAAAAAGAGVPLEPTTLLIFGNPKGGSPVMQTWPEFGLRLPLKLLVVERGAAVEVVYASMREEAAACGVAAGEPHVAAMDALLASLLETVMNNEA